MAKEKIGSIAANTAILKINETFYILLHSSCIDIVFVGTPRAYDWDKDTLTVPPERCPWMSLALCLLSEDLQMTASD